MRERRARQRGDVLDAAGQSRLAGDEEEARRRVERRLRRERRKTEAR
jgi:hypothetical protein